MTNGEEETALGFLVNYSKWIKPSENQKKRFQTYSRTKKNNKNSNSGRENAAKAPESGTSLLVSLTLSLPYFYLLGFGGGGGKCPRSISPKLLDVWQ